MPRARRIRRMKVAAELCIILGIDPPKRAGHLDALILRHGPGYPWPKTGAAPLFRGNKTRETTRLRRRGRRIAFMGGERPGAQ